MKYKVGDIIKDIHARGFTFFVCVVDADWNQYTLLDIHEIGYPHVEGRYPIGDVDAGSVLISSIFRETDV